MKNPVITKKMTTNNWSLSSSSAPLPSLISHYLSSQASLFKSCIRNMRSMILTQKTLEGNNGLFFFLTHPHFGDHIHNECSWKSWENLLPYSYYSWLLYLTPSHFSHIRKMQTYVELHQYHVRVTGDSTPSLSELQLLLFQLSHRRATKGNKSLCGSL